MLHVLWILLYSSAWGSRHLGTRTLPSVKDDWCAWLPREKDQAYNGFVRQLESGYHMFSVALDEALELTAAVAETMVIGGGEIYRAAWSRASRIYLTRVHIQTRADTFFPAVDPAEWRETAREDHLADAANPHDYSFITLERR